MSATNNTPSDSLLLPLDGLDMPVRPDFRLEHIYWQDGHRHIAGVDEAGRGPLAGPVVAAAVILDPENVPIRRKGWPIPRSSPRRFATGCITRS